MSEINSAFIYSYALVQVFSFALFVRVGQRDIVCPCDEIAARRRDWTVAGRRWKRNASASILLANVFAVGINRNNDWLKLMLESLKRCMVYWSQ